MLTKTAPLYYQKVVKVIVLKPVIGIVLNLHNQVPGAANSLQIKIYVGYN